MLRHAFFIRFFSSKIVYKIYFIEKTEQKIKGYTIGKSGI